MVSSSWLLTFNLPPPPDFTIEDTFSFPALSSKDAPHALASLKAYKPRNARRPRLLAPRFRSVRLRP